MTRYTRYRKTFNSKKIADEPVDEDGDEQLTEREAKMVKQDKEQSLEKLYASHNERTKPVCLRCRKRGHSLKFCPQGRESICYNCGSHEHTLKDCRQPREETLRFASCFVCKQKGHLSSHCKDNKLGIYPKGGGCRFCGSNQHLARDCRPTREADKGAFVGASVDRRRENPDEDLVFESLNNIQNEIHVKKSKKTAIPSAKKVTF